jgi:hypothetical protein
MAQSLTLRTRQVLDGGVISPNIILEIDGISTVFGSLVIEEVIRIGDTGLAIGEPIPGESSTWVIGGLTSISDQSDVVNFGSGTSNKIKTSLNPDKGYAESITSMQIAVLDQNEEMTQIISPGEVVEDILGRRCRVWYGFNNTAYKDDYLIIFRGVIDSVEAAPGLITFSIAHPDTKKKSTVFQKASNQLNGAINNAVTTITVDDTSDFFTRVTGPDGSYDSMAKFYIKIDDEIIQYTGLTGTTFTGCTRGALNTSAASHSDNANVESIVRLDGDAITLALKLMFSGAQGAYKENIAVTNFVRISSSETVSNSIFFQEYDVELETGIAVGDYITTSGATNGSNNVSLKEITAIETTELGSYIVVDGVTFVEEEDSAAVMSIRSKYDVWPDGLRMSGEDVDVVGHLKVYNRFLSAFEYDFVLPDGIDNAKEFLSEQIYNPAAAFALPKGTKAGAGYHLGPIPGDRIFTVDDTNVLNPGALKITRSTFKNFANTIAYRFQKDVLDDKFYKGIAGISQTSRDRIPVGNKSMVVESHGLRAWSIDNPLVAETGETLATTAINRKLKKFKFGAEYINGIQLRLSAGIEIEVDDIILLDMPSLQIVDIQNASRNGESRLFQVVNWSLDLLKGIVTIDVMDPNFDKDNRFGLIGPASQIKSATSTTQFLIEAAYYDGVYGSAEYKKWENYIGSGIRVHNTTDTSTSTSILTGVSGNAITVSPALSFTPSAGMIMSLGNYNASNDDIHALYAFMADDAFDDGSVVYRQI